jgi:hypothetical protein
MMNLHLPRAFARGISPEQIAMSEPGDFDGRDFRKFFGKPFPYGAVRPDERAFEPQNTEHQAQAYRMAVANKLLRLLEEWKASVESEEFSRSVYDRLGEGVARLKAADEASASPQFAQSIAEIEAVLERFGLRLDGPLRN